jgi:uncharacterized sulfatase
VLFPDDTAGIRPEHKTVAERLKEFGYATQCVGKWHLGCLPEHNPVKHGFDEFYGLLYSNDMNPLHLYAGETVIEEAVDQATLTERYTLTAIDFMEFHRDRPFFCYLAHTMPHIPLHVPEAFRGRSAAGTYGDTIECIDHYIGKIVDYLQERGILDDTLIIVTSDNGPWYEGSTAGLRGRKFDVFEGGIRMPFIARWGAGIPAGRECHEIASLMDIAPTLLELAGGNPADVPEFDGKPIPQLLSGDGASPHEELYFYVNDSLNAVRSGRWKLHVDSGQGKRKEMPQLFDMDHDPTECYNVANLQPDIVEELIRKIEEFDRTVQPVQNAQRGNRI